MSRIGAGKPDCDAQMAAALDEAIRLLPTFFPCTGCARAAAAAGTAALSGSASHTAVAYGIHSTALVLRQPGSLVNS